MKNKIIEISSIISICLGMAEMISVPVVEKTPKIEWTSQNLMIDGEHSIIIGLNLYLIKEIKEKKKMKLNDKEKELIIWAIEEHQQNLKEAINEAKKLKVKKHEIIMKEAINELNKIRNKMIKS